jgi:DNA-binding NarL/FixJ family response regulator
MKPNLIEKTIVLKPSPSDDEVDEVYTSISLWEGREAITETILKMLSLHSLDSDSDPFRGLSPREETIVRLVSLGLTNKQIAHELFLSTHTVTTHRKNISSKLGIKSVSGLTVYAIVNNIITIDEVTSKPDQ